MSADQPLSEPLSGEDLVRIFLKAQNLEQMQRFDDAAPLYERMVEAGFDSSGPYDRLIAIYSNHERHDDVVRIATAALERVRTFEAKTEFYRSMLQKAGSRGNDTKGAEF